ncbi:hypothetical protein FLLO111716_09740 [Flavobacterium longum]|uniref:GNAT family N-acetyltransferase n=1 Tax=Flavobacterium longum TaxID=1299340 RepID=UPI0039EBF760
MEINTLDGVTTSEIADTFNVAFSDYVVPLTLSEADVASKILLENIALQCSAGAFSDGKLVGFILIGTNGIVAYNAGTGVIPGCRGQNLTRRMYDFLLPRLAEKGIVQHRLEVIAANVKAIRVYEQMGFKTSRKVTCFKGKVATARNHGATIRRIEFSDINTPENFWDFVPTYQNASDVMFRMPLLHGTFGAFDGDLLVGYVAFATASLRIKQFAVAENYRRKGIGQQLFGHVQQLDLSKDVSVINVDDASGSIEFLKSIGLTETVSQLDMQLFRA